jgi:Zn-finger domain-containing protein
MLSDRDLEEFGRFLITKVRDRFLNIFYVYILQDRGILHDSMLSVRVRREFSNEQFKLIEELVADCIDSTISGLLNDIEFSISETNTMIYINGIPITEYEESLQIKLFSDEGWIAKFSEFSDEHGLHASQLE